MLTSGSFIRCLASAVVEGHGVGKSSSCTQWMWHILSGIALRFSMSGGALSGTLGAGVSDGCISGRCDTLMTTSATSGRPIYVRLVPRGRHQGCGLSGRSGISMNTSGGLYPGLHSWQAPGKQSFR